MSKKCEEYFIKHKEVTDYMKEISEEQWGMIIDDWKIHMNIISKNPDSTVAEILDSETVLKLLENGLKWSQDETFNV
jgi:hypothetical protein